MTIDDDVPVDDDFDSFQSGYSFHCQHPRHGETLPEDGHEISVYISTRSYDELRKAFELCVALGAPEDSCSVSTFEYDSWREDDAALFFGREEQWVAEANARLDAAQRGEAND